MTTNYFTWMEHTNMCGLKCEFGMSICKYICSGAGLLGILNSLTLLNSSDAKVHLTKLQNIIERYRGFHEKGSFSFLCALEIDI